MAYKISGTLNESARILVLKESDWSIESNVEKSAGSYEIKSLVSGTKTVVAIDDSGEVVGYGSVTPESYTGDRGVFGGGYSGEYQNCIDYITISSLGNAIDFGDFTRPKSGSKATSNGGYDRGVFVDGGSGNAIEYITISSIGNATEFGGLTVSRPVAATSNGTNDRGVFGGGYTSSYSNIIDYITISTTGNATDFGDLTVSRKGMGATSNGTNNRGVFGGGRVDADEVNIIDYITISSLGNATDFGDLCGQSYCVTATSNGTNDRGVFGGGYPGQATYRNNIDYITISTTGNATDFGDLTRKGYALASTSNGINNRGVFGGGYASGHIIVNIIDYITISSPGNATDFGDLTIARDYFGAASNA